MGQAASRGRPRPGRLTKPTEQRTQSVSAIAARIAVPPPSTAETSAAREAQEVARTELLMLKGVRRVDHLMASLGISNRKRMDGLIAAVHARWEVTGSEKSPTRHRGEAMRKLDLIESELWIKWSNAEDYRAESAIMSRILDAVRLRTEVAGLTPRVVERLAMMPDATNDLAARVAQQSGLAVMAGRLAEIIAERRAALGLPASTVIDGEAVSRPRHQDADAEEDAEAC